MRRIRERVIQEISNILLTINLCGAVDGGVFGMGEVDEVDAILLAVQCSF